MNNTTPSAPGETKTHAWIERLRRDCNSNLEQQHVNSRQGNDPLAYVVLPTWNDVRLLFNELDRANCRVTDLEDASLGVAGWLEVCAHEFRGGDTSQRARILLSFAKRLRDALDHGRIKP